MAKPKKILVVGYDPSLLTTRKMVLQGGGYEVVSVDSDHEAMKLLADNGFDLIVLGTSVPPKGFEQLEKRIRDAHPKTFIVKIPSGQSGPNRSTSLLTKVYRLS
jgi:CheY-like chemotaxis protein